MKPKSFLIIPWLMAAVAVSAADDPAGIAFFEQKIRPVLVEHCYECHSSKAKKLKGGLYLDSKAGWQKGGDAGVPTIIPGKPDEGLFLRYVRHLEPDMEMPPKKPKSLSKGSGRYRSVTKTKTHRFKALWYQDVSATA